MPEMHKGTKVQCNDWLIPIFQDRDHCLVGGGPVVYS